MKEQTHIREAAQTSALLMDCLHTGNQYESVYEAQADNLNGFVGVAEYVGNIAVIFTGKWFELSQDSKDQLEWVELIFDLSNIIHNKRDSLIDEDWDKIVSSVIDLS